MIKATFDALENLASPRAIAAKRGKKVSDIVGRRDGAQAAAQESSAQEAASEQA